MPPRNKASKNHQSAESLGRTKQTTLDAHVLRDTTESPATESSATERNSSDALPSEAPLPVTPSAEPVTTTAETHTAPSVVHASPAGVSAVEWIRAPYGDETALGKGMFPFKRTANDLLIQDLTVHGRVTLVDLKPGVQFNHVVDILVDETQIAKLKEFAYTYSGLPTEASGEMRWKDTPIRFSGDVLHCVNKKDLHLAFTDVWDARGVDDPLEIESDERMELDWGEVKKSCRVLVETIPEIYFRPAMNLWGVTLHMVTVGLLTGPEDEKPAISFQSPKKKRKVTATLIKMEPVEDVAAE
jgi:hypothetical protein